MDESPLPAGADGEAPMPRWVYIVGILVILGALGFVAVHLGGGGIPQHGPPR